MTDDARDIVDWAYFEKSRTELGPGLHPHPQLFQGGRRRSRSPRSRQAMREQNTTALVLPAHTLKGESRQLGAEPLAKIAELIETTARFCIETHRFPDELVPEVVELRRLFDQTVELFDKATNPLIDARRARRLRPQGQQPGVRPDLVLLRGLATAAGCNSGCPSARSSRTAVRACRHALPHCRGSRRTGRG